MGVGFGVAVGSTDVGIENVDNVVGESSGVGEVIGITSAGDAVGVVSIGLGEKILHETTKPIDTVHKYRFRVRFIDIMILPKVQRTCRVSPVHLFILCRCYGIVAGMSQFRNRQIPRNMETAISTLLEQMYFTDPADKVVGQVNGTYRMLRAEKT